MQTAFCSYQESTSVRGSSLMPQPKDFGEGLRNIDRTVGIVALPHVENARDAADLAEVEVVEAVFAAGKGQDDGIHRCLFDKFRVVISAGMCAVAAADEENVSDRAGFDCFDKLRGAGEDGSVSKSRSSARARR